MDIKKYAKKLMLYIFIGIIIGILLVFFREWFDFTPSKLQIGLLFVILCFLILIISYYKMLNPVALVSKGKFEEALEKFNKVLESYSNTISVKNIHLYNIANCHNRMGNFEESINFLNKIDFSKLDKNTRGGYYVLYCANLLMLEKELNLAKEYVNKACEFLNIPYIQIYKAFIELLDGNASKADEILQEYIKTNEKKKIKWGFSAALLFDKFSVDIENNFYIGLYYFKKSELNLAKAFLLKATMCGYRNYYSERAKQLIAQIG